MNMINQVAVAIAVMIICASIIGASVAFMWRNEWESKCESLGGVPVRSQCIKRDAIIKVP